MIVELFNKDKKINTDGDQVRFVQNIIDTVKEGYDEIVDVGFFSFTKEVVLRNPKLFQEFSKEFEEVNKVLEEDPEEEIVEEVTQFSTKPEEVVTAPLPEEFSIEVVRKAASKKELVEYLDSFVIKYDNSLGLKKLVASIEAYAESLGSNPE